MARRREKIGPLPTQFHRAFAVVEDVLKAALEECKRTMPAFAKHCGIHRNEWLDNSASLPAPPLRAPTKSTSDLRYSQASILHLKTFTFLC